ncbi:hypothetical protein TYRP_020353 [Tyrophagus putrescentiae]|nr:hypothetical protein TYRP_020353 [Tyrophagus putrescentiae]
MPPLISVTASSKRKLLFCRVKSTLAQATATFFHITITPFPNLEPFKKYFVAHRSILAGNAEVLFCFKAYVFLTAYMTGVWLMLSAFGSPLSIPKFVSPLFSLAIRLLLVDNLEIMQAPERSSRQFYLLQAGISVALLYLHWALYCRPGNAPLNDLLEDVFFSEQNTVTEMLPQQNTSKNNNTISVKEVGQVGSFRQAQVTFLDVGLLIYMSALGRYLLLLLLQTDYDYSFFCHFFQHYLSKGHFVSVVFFLLYWLLVLLFLFTLLLVHLLLLYFPIWTAFAHTTSFFITLTILTLSYFYRLFRQHYKALQRKLHRCLKTSKTRPPKCRRNAGVHHHPHHHHHHHAQRFTQINACLQTNLHLFSAIFAGDAFLGQLFTIYLTFHLPLTVYATVLLVHGQALEHLLVGLVFVGGVTEALLGSAFIHLSVARLSSCLHQGGRMLVAFTAENGAGGNAADETCCRFRPLPTRFALHLSVHISRLLVRRKYGITYGYLGTLVTMKTFFKCLLLWSELLMYAFTLMGNAK